MAVLHHKGNFSLWKLKPRLGPGPGKAVDPAEVTYFENKEPKIGRAIQIHVQEKPNAPNTFRILTLASHDDFDVLTVFKYADNIVERVGAVELPGTGGRIMASEAGLYWQNHDGTIFSGAHPYPFRDLIVMIFSSPFAH